MAEEYISSYARDGQKPENKANISSCGISCSNKYLFLYNMTMFVMFTTVVLTILMNCYTGITDQQIEYVAYLVKILTYAQLLETIHPMLGLVPGGPFMPFLQVLGRMIVNYYLIEPEILHNSKPFAHLLLLVWSTIEIFRYSYYTLRVLNIEQYLITWLRYSLFIPLYPLGGIGESRVVFATIAYYEKNNLYNLKLPNAANISFNSAIFLKFYIFFMLWPTIYFLMKHMWHQRGKQLIPKKPSSFKQKKV